MPVVQDPGTVPVPCVPLLDFRLTEVNKKNAKKFHGAETHKNTQASNDARALGGRVYQSARRASVVARRPERRGQRAETRRHELTRDAASSGFETVRFTLYQTVSIQRLTAWDPTGSP